ncbi:hypothetical protein H0H92_005595, partial [Tricholoma furcatifolium]
PPEVALTVACRACPQPGINLLPGWDKAPFTVGWIYQLFLSQDANFRLKNRLRSSEEKDPSLSPGGAYFMSTDEYLKHLAMYVDEDEISHCVGFAALWLANTRKAKGLRATGVGYSNMDFILFSVLASTAAHHILLCYDIACQYCQNFGRRSNAMPANLQLINAPKIRFKVPKFHLPPHKPECHGPYSLNFTPRVGRTDGEGVERNWSWLNGAAPSTSQMGPGAQHDTLDDFMGFWNYHRMVELEKSLLKDMIRAIPEWISHRQAFTIFTDTLQENYATEVREWNRQVMEWEEDQTKPDPYLVKEKGVTINEIRWRLAEEEHHRVERGLVSATITPATFVMMGLEIEDTKERFCTDGLAYAEDCLRDAHLSESLEDLRRQLRIRVLAQKFKDENASSQGAYTCMQSLNDQINSKIRAAKAQYDTSQMALWNLRGAGEWEAVYRVLKPQDLHSVNERTITQAEEDERAWTYNIAADRNLPHTVSTLNLQIGEGHRTVSWIWYNISQCELDNDESLNEGICLEWLKARARAERWKEEICLVEEEMRHVLEYGQWKAAWWKEQGRKRVGSSTVLAEGLLAYATEQANIEEARVQACELRWKDVRQRAQEVLADDSGTISFPTIEVALDTTEEEEKEMWASLEDDDNDDE